MSLRTIMIFPEFENMEIIDSIRKRYDPLADLVRPHITIVFPFESRMSNKELSEILENRLKSVKSFEIKLQGISRQKDTFGNYLFLDVLQGQEEICGIHNMLYDNEFKEFVSGRHYVPHMTIGKLPAVEMLNEAYDEVKSIKESFITIVNKISVEMIGDNEESIIIIEKNLA